MNHKKYATIVAMIIFFTLSLGIFLVFVEHVSAVETSMAKIVAFDGQVIITSKDRILSPVVDMPLFPGDNIKTKKGVVKIQFTDGSILDLLYNTQVTIDEKKEEEKGWGLFKTAFIKRKIKVFLGSLFADIKSGSGIQTDFETPTVVAGIRGTGVEITVDADGNFTIGCASGGPITIIWKDGSQKPIELQAGQWIKIDKDGNIVKRGDGLKKGDIAASLELEKEAKERLDKLVEIKENQPIEPELEKGHGSVSGWHFGHRD